MDRSFASGKSQRRNHTPTRHWRMSFSVVGRVLVVAVADMLLPCYTADTRRLLPGPVPPGSMLGYGRWFTYYTHTHTQALQGCAIQNQMNNARIWIEVANRMQKSEFKELKWNELQINQITAASEVYNNTFYCSVWIAHKHTQYRACAKGINVHANLQRFHYILLTKPLLVT